MPHASLLWHRFISRAAKVAGLMIAFISVSLILAASPMKATASVTLTAWGAGTTNTGIEPEYGQSIIPVGLTGIKAIAGGGYHTVALKTDGTVAAWGWDDFGQTDVPVGLNGVIAVSAGLYHTVALKSDGTVVAWGAITGICFPNCGQSNVPAGLTGVIAISAGRVHTMALKSDGTVVVWGAVGYDLGQTNVPAGLTGVKAIAAGAYHNLAVKNDGTVVAWGWNDQGQINVPADLTDVKAVAAGYEHSVALKNDGTVVVWGDNGGFLTNVPAGLSGVTAIAANWDGTQALKSDGTVVAWGGNAYGDSIVPDGLSGVTAISAGYFHTIALVGSPGPTYNFTGFFRPVDNLPNLNVATAGSAIPFKFGLGGDQGLNIFAAGYPISGPITCDANEPGTVIDETVNAGGSNLSYDASSGQYNYVWKTNKAWKGTCRILVIRFIDGTDHIAKFSFR
jgi:alpha-tubulin suppressor-like RCC1 family protein